MEKEIISRIIREGQDYIPEIELYNRPMELELKGNYVFVGVRQCGKSYMLYQRIQQLLQEGHSIKEIVYVNYYKHTLPPTRASLCCFSTKSKTLRGGSILPVGWPTKNIKFSSPAAMPKCSVATSPLLWEDDIGHAMSIHLHSRNTLAESTLTSIRIGTTVHS